jgi:hypothetical protein
LPPPVAPAAAEERASMSAMRTAKVTLAAGLGLISLLESVVNKRMNPPVE